MRLITIWLIQTMGKVLEHISPILQFGCKSMWHWLKLVLTALIAKTFAAHCTEWSLHLLHLRQVLLNVISFMAFSFADMQCTYFLLALLTQQTTGQQQCCESRTVGGTGEKVKTHIHRLNLKGLGLK